MAEQSIQQQPKLPAVNYLSTAQDDYIYESRPLPKRVTDELARGQQSGGMASQFEIVSSGLNNNV